MSDPARPPVRSGVSADTQRWRDVAGELAPVKTLVRVVDNGRFVIGTVSTVGVLLTGFGLVAADRLSASAGPRRAAAAAVALAVAAVLLALVPLVVRTRRVNLDNLADVKELYRRELRKAGLISAAGWVLALALLAAGTAGVWAAVSSPATAPGRPTAALTAARGAEGTAVHATATVAGLRPGAMVEFEVATTGPPSRTVLLAGATLAGADGTATLDEAVVDPAAGRSYELIVRSPGEAPVVVSAGFG